MHTTPTLWRWAQSIWGKCYKQTHTRIIDWIEHRRARAHTNTHCSVRQCDWTNLANGLNWRTIIKTVQFRKFWCDYKTKGIEEEIDAIFLSLCVVDRFVSTVDNKFGSRINSLDERIDEKWFVRTFFDQIDLGNIKAFVVEKLFSGMKWDYNLALPVYVYMLFASKGQTVVNILWRPQSNTKSTEQKWGTKWRSADFIIYHHIAVYYICIV